MSEYCNNVRNMTISEVVKFIRNTKYMPLQQLGYMFGVSKSSVWQWENGNVEPRKSIKEKQDFAKAGVFISWITD